MVRKQHASMVPLSGSHLQPDRDSCQTAPDEPKALKVEVSESSVVSETTNKVREDPEPKMIKLGRKKVTSSVTLRVLSNRGHGRMVGIAGLEIYSTSG